MGCSTEGFPHARKGVSDFGASLTKTAHDGPEALSDKLRAASIASLSVRPLSTIKSARSLRCSRRRLSKTCGDLEAVIATNAILDEERDKRLIGLLGKDDNSADSITEIAKLLGQAPRSLSSQRADRTGEPASPHFPRQRRVSSPSQSSG